jgi:hypothetical protein
MHTLHFRTIDPAFPLQPTTGYHSSSFCSPTILHSTQKYVYVSYILDAVDISVGKQERQPITVRDSKVRVVICRNLCRKNPG